MFNHSFHQSYNSAMHVPYTEPSHSHALYGQDYAGSMYGAMYSEHKYHSEHGYDMSDTNDSGVNSEDNDYNNDKDAGEYLWKHKYANKKEINNKSEKPLSAWKAKQLKLSTLGVIKRRRDANNRERKRMNGLNEAFERLREHIPGDTKHRDKKLSKMDTLQMANIYIRQLAALLEESS